MRKYLISHIVLYLCPHDMAKIRNIKVTETFYSYQRHHQGTQLYNDLHCLVSRKGDHVCRNVPDDQRDGQSHPCA